MISCDHVTIIILSYLIHECVFCEITAICSYFRGFQSFINIKGLHQKDASVSYMTSYTEKD